MRRYFLSSITLLSLVGTSTGPALAQPSAVMDGRLLPLRTDTFAVHYGDTEIGQSIMERLRQGDRLLQVYTWISATGEIIVDSLWTEFTTLRPIRELRVVGADLEEVTFGRDTLLVVGHSGGATSRSAIPRRANAYSSASLDAIAAAVDLSDGYAQDLLLYYVPPSTHGYVTVRLSVQGSARVTMADNVRDAWVVAASTPSGGSTFWIDKGDRTLLQFDTREGNATIQFRR